MYTRLGRLIYSMDVSRSLNVPLAACLPVFYQCSTKHGTHKGTLADKLPVAQRLIPLMLQDVHNLPSRVYRKKKLQKAQGKRYFCRYTKSVFFMCCSLLRRAQLVALLISQSSGITFHDCGRKKARECPILGIDISYFYVRGLRHEKRWTRTFFWTDPWN